MGYFESCVYRAEVKGHMTAYSITLLLFFASLPYRVFWGGFVHGNIILWFQNSGLAPILVLRTPISLLAELQNRILQQAYISTTDTGSCQQQEHHTVLLERHTEFCYSVMKELSITGSLNRRKF